MNEFEISSTYIPVVVHMDSSTRSKAACAMNWLRCLWSSLWRIKGLIFIIIWPWIPGTQFSLKQAVNKISDTWLQNLKRNRGINIKSSLCLCHRVLGCHADKCLECTNCTYLVILLPALGGIHRFHRGTKLHFKDWIVAMTNDSKVIIS